MQFENTLQNQVDIGVFNIEPGGGLGIRWTHSLAGRGTMTYTPEAPFSRTDKYRVNVTNILMLPGWIDIRADDHVTISQSKNQIVLTSP